MQKNCHRVSAFVHVPSKKKFVIFATVGGYFVLFYFISCIVGAICTFLFVLYLSVKKIKIYPVGYMDLKDFFSFFFF